MKYKISFFLIALFFFFNEGKTQQLADTTIINFKQAEELFLKNNFILLANHYNIDIASAAVEQAKLFSNPTIFAEINAYNPINRTWFFTNKYNDPSTGSTYYGSYSFQINQLIQLAGKRSKLVNLAKANVSLNKAAFDDIIRQLHNQLFISFTNLTYDIQALKLYQEEEIRIASLVDIEKYAVQKGAASGYELTRLQFELQDMQDQIKTIQNRLTDDNTTFMLLLNDSSKTAYIPEAINLRNNNLPNLSQITDSALVNRPDLILATTQVDISNLNLKVQQANKIPDLTIGATYDRFGGAYLNYTGLNVALPLTIFNRNQGGIKQAKFGVEQSKILLNQSNFSVKQDVNNAFFKLSNLLSEKNKIQDGYEASLQNISIKATESYNKRVIGLLDYLDKIHTYRNAKINLLSLQLEILQAQNNINFTSNTLFYKF